MRFVLIVRQGKYGYWSIFKIELETGNDLEVASGFKSYDEARTWCTELSADKIRGE